MDFQKSSKHNSTAALLATDEILEILIAVAANIQAEIPQYYKGKEQIVQLQLGAFLASEAMILAIRGMKEAVLERLSKHGMDA
jgi:hypothetical protein